MIRQLLLHVLLLISFLSLTLATDAQGWEKRYSPDRPLHITCLFQRPDQTYFMSGESYNNENQLRLMKLAANGTVIWVKDYDSINAYSKGAITQDGGYLMAGYASYFPETGSNPTPRALLKVDSLGNKLWLKFIPAFQNGIGAVGNIGLDTTDNGGFIYTYDTSDSTKGSPTKRIITRDDGNGDTVWSNSYFDGDTSLFIYIIQNSKDGGFIATVGGGTPANGGSRLFKIDSAGNMLWQYIAPYPDASVSATIARDGNILVCGGYYPNGTSYAPASFIGKIDQNGQQLWLEDFLGLPDSVGMGALIENNNNTYSLIGGRYFPEDLFDYFRVDSAGHILYHQRIPQDFNDAYLFPGVFIATQDGGYTLGYVLPNDPNGYSSELVKMDSNAIVYPHLLSGITFLDSNNNCARDSGELLLKENVLQFTNATDTLTTASDDSGYYYIGLNDGTYQLQITPYTHYTVPSNCDPTQVTVNGIDSVINLGILPTTYGPYITVDGETHERICYPISYTAQYCNSGTAPFTGVIDLTFDSLASIDSASTPWITPQTGTTYQFQVDTLGVMDCGTITVYYHLPCADSLLGRTLCIDADVYADTVVTPAPGWDKSNLSMTVDCQTDPDSVIFTLKNTGTGTTSTPPEMIVIEDNVISVKQVAQLSSGAQFVLKEIANGSTWRATVPQTPNNPYSSFTTAAVEGCGVNAVGGISKGYYTEYPYNGYYAFHYSTCSVVKNSADPNSKSVSPTGAGADHVVDSSTQLEYTIDFQNTGTDTAIFVTVVDTLATYLDPTTLKTGISSSPYEVQLNNNVLTFTFYNINLPDSADNQAASNGYVKFRIKQKSSNPSGIVINNDAAIYFDYNAPVVTNTATVTLGILIFSGIETLDTNKEVLITAFPNPFNNQAVIRVEGETFDQLQLTIFDMTGRMMKQQYVGNSNQFILDGNGFSNGSYLFEIHSHNQLIGRGKIVAE